MKTKLTLLALAFTTLAMQAQTTFRPQLREGDVFTYTSEATMKMNMPQAGMNVQDMHMSCDQRYTVKTVNKDSAIIETVVTRMDMPKEMTATGSEPFSESFGNIQSLGKTPVLMSVNLDGTPRHVLNISEIKTKMSEYLNSLKKDNDGQEAAEGITNYVCNDSTILAAIDQSGLFKYFGKLLKTGDTDKFNVMGIKAKRAYTVSADGKRIDVTYSPDMTTDDVKQMLLTQLKAAGQEEAATQIEAGWPQMVAMGLANVEMSGTESMTFGDKGWPQHINSDMKTNMFGMEMTITSKATLK